ncbi:alpha-2,8-polysialyltransferase family protein [Pontibacter silvestris]|uniref:Alpha-2,8-polysialyltransferase family protein n=1 Tax=Pontibacter silvestris TaxID=2305183 RepID=A0ABW4WSX6_9BACT|nr:alpha-2,8-polysialyltransferase family protein [Pontibacter silvestris]MCC9138101.1 alpha-2,8-polysialyltransferase family protein [Pontibacter silvestris]
MPSKPNLLFVGDYNREDYLNLFTACKQHFSFYFLEYTSAKEESSTLYKEYGQAIYWSNFNSAFELLDIIKPHKVIFTFIESYFHTALNLTCKVKGVTTYHIDHGIRDININVRFETLLINYIKQGAKTSKFITIIKQLLPRLKARIFLLNTYRKLPFPEAQYMMSFSKVRRKNIYLETKKLVPSPFALPTAYISFSPSIFKVHQFYDTPPPNYKVHHIGIPNFDHLAGVLPHTPHQKYVLFIDQGLHIRNMFGWSLNTYKNFITQLSQELSESGYTIYAKPHPTQFNLNKDALPVAENISIIDDIELKRLLPSTRIVLGFFSTYLLPIAALPHTTLITLENHPAGKLLVSKSFVDAGVAHPVYDMQELDWALQHVEQLHQEQLPNKKQFEQDWLYKFDGKAGERLRDILLREEL